MARPVARNVACLRGDRQDGTADLDTWVLSMWFYTHVRKQCTHVDSLPSSASWFTPGMARQRETGHPFERPPKVTRQGHRRKGRADEHVRPAGPDGYLSLFLKGSPFPGALATALPTRFSGAPSLFQNPLNSVFLRSLTPSERSACARP